MSTPPTLIDYTQHVYKRINTRKFMYVRDIKHTLKHYNQDTKGKKTELIARLDAFFTYIKNMEKYTLEIITIQKYIRGYLTRRKMKNKDYYFRLNRCNNTEDFYTFQSIDDIEPLYFFSYTDKDNFSYFFDIRSFEKLNKGSHANPYNREPIPLEAIEKFNNRMDIVSKDIDFKPFETPKLTDEQTYRNYVIEVFQGIDLTNCIAGGTDISWYLNLDFNQLIRFYEVLEDIWVYRANLTPYQRNLIVPDRNIFDRIEFDYLYKKKNKARYKKLMKYFILKNMEKLITASNESCHRATGAYYILIALVGTSTSCAHALPWLIQ